LRILGVRYVAALFVALGFATSAAAKGDVVAHLENPAVLGSHPGTTVALVWTLREQKHPFTALGIYVRLHGLATVRAPATELSPGRFLARVTIPRGGVHSIVIALTGWRLDAHGRHRADVRFRIDNDPTTRTRRAAVC
jgi:hypothetical protein